MKLRTMVISAIGVAGLFGVAIAYAAPSSKKGASAATQKGVDAENEARR